MVMRITPISSAFTQLRLEAITNAVAMDRMVQKMAVSTLENKLFHRLV